MGLSVLLYDNGDDFSDLPSALMATLNYGLYGEFTMTGSFVDVMSTCYGGGEGGGLAGEEERCSLHLSAYLLFSGMMVSVQARGMAREWRVNGV